MQLALSLGGIARVLNSYNYHVFETSKFVKTTREDNIFIKVCALVYAIVYYIFLDVKLVHVQSPSYNSLRRKVY